MWTQECLGPVGCLLGVAEEFCGVPRMCQVENIYTIKVFVIYTDLGSCFCDSCYNVKSIFV